MKFFDSYEWHARIQPGALLALPVVITSAACSTGFFEFTRNLLTSLGAAFLLLRLLGLWVRYLGKRVEPVLWNTWDGPPSTAFMLPEHTRFSDGMKAKLGTVSKSLTGMRFPDDEAFRTDRERAKQKAYDIFSQLRAVLRERNPDGLWVTHNMEYGYARNLYGSLNTIAVLAIIGALACAVFWAVQRTSQPCYGFALNLAYLAFALYARRWMPAYVRGCAERYAESAWMAVSQLSKQEDSSSGKSKQSERSI